VKADAAQVVHNLIGYVLYYLKDGVTLRDIFECGAGSLHAVDW
jgi:hypothetical protein